MAADRQFCTFLLAGHHFGVDVTSVQEVIRAQEMTRVPLTPPVVRGLINLRGQIVTAKVVDVATGGIEVAFGEGEALRTFIRKSDLSRDRQEQRADRFSVGDRLDAMVTGFDKATRKVSLSVKAMELADEKEAIAQFGSSDSGASLGDILGAALKNKQ